MNMHRDPAVHEPFNGHRDMVDIRDDFERARKNGESFRIDEARVLSRNYKICYEYTHEEFNEYMFEFFKEKNFYQILLVRRNERERLESLALAKLTDTFGVRKAKEIYPKIVDGSISLEPLDVYPFIAFAKQANVRHKKVYELFEADKLPIFFMEDYFAGTFEECLQRFNRLVSEMRSAGVELEHTEKTEWAIQEYFGRRDQKSRDIVDYIPNIGEVRRLIGNLSFIKGI